MTLHGTAQASSSRAFCRLRAGREQLPASGAGSKRVPGVQATEGAGTGEVCLSDGGEHKMASAAVLLAQRDHNPAVTETR